MLDFSNFRVLNFNVNLSGNFSPVIPTAQIDAVPEFDISFLNRVGHHFSGEAAIILSQTWLNLNDQDKI